MRLIVQMVGGEPIIHEHEAESCLARGNGGKRIYEHSQDPEIDISFRSFLGFPHFSVLQLLKRNSRTRVILTVTQTIKYCNSRRVYVLKLVRRILLLTSIDVSHPKPD